ncbi:helix-turn-helix domain-containing protein [Morganella morganii]|uniref:helix-turn-helix domain-containing protein n=1 Tax=Morganella morganii TaxID=582 RepID=UPI0021CF949E|nr:helix-turn-helix transcriptional regulator [Morganella morganii]MCU6354917.1 helix-turn-helix domain-containing protein [Morganella morganii]
MSEAQDWHPADIIAAIKKRGTSLSALSRNAGLRPSTLNNALARRWPKGERRKAKGERRKAKGEKIIADFLNVSPAEIWPSRYMQKIY